LFFQVFDYFFAKYGFVFAVASIVPAEGDWKCQPAHAPNYRYHC